VVQLLLPTLRYRDHRLHLPLVPVASCCLRGSIRWRLSSSHMRRGDGSGGGGRSTGSSVARSREHGLERPSTATSHRPPRPPWTACTHRNGLGLVVVATGGVVRVNGDDNGGRWGGGVGEMVAPELLLSPPCRLPHRGVGEMGTWRGSPLTLAPVAAAATTASMARSCVSEAGRQMVQAISKMARGGEGEERGQNG
jgi:hypothetical protein